MHIRGGRRLNKLRGLPKELKNAYRVYPVLGVAAWISSILFHTRDTAFTEKLDYFSAAASILWTLYIALVRFLHLSARPTLRRFVLLALMTMYGAHVGYLSFWKFDYKYNMIFNIAIGLMHNGIWFIWSGWYYLTTSPSPALSSPTLSTRPASKRGVARKARPPHIHLPLIVLSGFMAAMALEILDFPPLWSVLDAHAAWHAATVVVVPWWYEVYVRDAGWLAGQ